MHRLGFSLVELMAVVAIIAVLSALTLPRYRAFVARSRMGEAKVNLKHIASLQALYLTENAEYYSGLEVGNIGGAAKCNFGSAHAGAWNELGFQPDDCFLLRYGYTTSAAIATFKGIANSNGKVIYPECSEDDEWQWDVLVSLTKPLQHTVNVVKECSN